MIAMTHTRLSVCTLFRTILSLSAIQFADFTDNEIKITSTIVIKEHFCEQAQSRNRKALCPIRDNDVKHAKLHISTHSSYHLQKTIKLKFGEKRTA